MPEIQTTSALAQDAAASDPVERDPHGLFTALRRMVPKSQVLRYLIVGGWNTVFALALYFIFAHLFSRAMPHHLPWAAVLANTVSTPLGITMSFLCYKHFVFHTKGNYVKEWLRCFAVYSISFPVGLCIIFAVTHILSHWTPNHAAQIAGVVNSGISAIYSYFAHKKFSFKK